MSWGDLLAILQGAVVTVSLSFAGILIGSPIGLALAVVRWADVPVAARAVAVYVSILRATPLVTLLLLLFFALPNIGIAMDPISAAILALVMSTAAFNCEVWRAALMNFPKDQYEAAQSVGMNAALSIPPHLAAADRARQPSRPRQRDVAADQGDAGARRGRASSTSRARRCGSAPRPTSRCRRFWSRSRSTCRSCLYWFRCSAGSNGARSAVEARMIHDFGIVWGERSLLLSGLANTAILSVLSAAAALLVGFILTPALMSKRAWLAGRRAASSTSCGACRSCCLPISSITGFRRSASGWTIGPPGLRR